MYCQSCGKERRPNSNFCPHCGAKQVHKQKLSPFTIIILSLLLIGTIGVSIFVVTSFYSNISDTLAFEEEPVIEQQEPDLKPEVTESTTPVTEKKQLQDEQKRELTDIIAAAQETVYTVFTAYSQGSGFLYNSSGAVVTNAHVVEGETEVYIKTINGIEYPGTVIGYSNETDVAVIHVPDLVGVKPFELEVNDTTKIGEEIIALGSPLGLENTATMGYITGKNRSFVIDPYVYENLYQISAPISPGSSGGPLISKTSEKIIAINSAESLEDASIGFSIPLYTIHSLIESWINEPMSEEDIFALYYGDNYYSDSWEKGYFDGGEYSEDEDYYNYWEYDYEDFWSEFGDAIWEYMEEEDSYYDEWYDEYDDSYEEDWSEDGSLGGSGGDEYVDPSLDTEEDIYADDYAPSDDENMYYDEETGEWSYYDEVEDQWYFYDNELQTWSYYEEYDGLWYYYDEALGEYVPY
ncbi:trypsin-like peptidase domain-containing protein [Ornithinibacillus californiensis]|uniref:trypsin-like peptidase domain-containing protein n=1 Tax=Ornithinibacillus californiensis TaxID=161536 RepID=UPI00064DF364|nr:trypsin-like peptidase domain-containing protein [Ornithinibacillus californiensis]